MTSVPPPLTKSTRSKPSVNTSRNSISTKHIKDQKKVNQKHYMSKVTDGSIFHKINALCDNENASGVIGLHRLFFIQKLKTKGYHNIFLVDPSYIMK